MNSYSNTVEELQELIDDIHERRQQISEYMIYRSSKYYKIKQPQPTNNTCKHKQPWYNKNRW